MTLQSDAGNEGQRGTQRAQASARRCGDERRRQRIIERIHHRQH